MRFTVNELYEFCNYEGRVNSGSWDDEIELYPVEKIVEVVEKVSYQKKENL